MSNKNDVYQKFGDVAHLASRFEEQLGNICIMNERVMNQHKYDPNNSEHIDTILKKFKAPIGFLLADLKKVLGADMEEKVDLLFKPALEKRNRLIHGFFMDYYGILENDPSTIQKALKELFEIERYIIKAEYVSRDICAHMFALYQGAPIE